MISTRPSVARPTVSRDLRPLVPISEGARIYHVIHITTNCRPRRDSPLVRVRRNDRDSNPDHQEWEGAPWTTTPPRLYMNGEETTKTVVSELLQQKFPASRKRSDTEGTLWVPRGHCGHRGDIVGRDILGTRLRGHCGHQGTLWGGTFWGAE